MSNELEQSQEEFFLTRDEFTESHTQGFPGLFTFRLQLSPEAQQCERGR